MHCTEVRGGETVLNAPLTLRREQDALLIPMGLTHKPGLYNASGVLVRDAAYFRGLPEAHFPLEEAVTTFAGSSACFAPDGPCYIFAGHLTGHYGHFLFSMLGRLWSLPKPLPSNVKLVLLNGIHAADLFELDFSRTIFNALGIRLENFANFQEAVRFRQIIIPAPSIEENHQGHPAFADLCHFIGEAVLGGSQAPIDTRPVYLTKQRVSAGVHRISNEESFCAFLERQGVEIISPELLSFRDQIQLWCNRPSISGVSGSMMHTSIFIPHRSYVALNPEPWINSNQAILDKLNGNSAHVLYPKDGYQREKASEGFGHVLRLRNPERAAEDFLNEAKLAWRHGLEESSGSGNRIARRFQRLLEPLRSRSQ